MPPKGNKLIRLMNSLSFRLQSMTALLSLVGVAFGVRAYIDVLDQFGETGSSKIYSDLMIQIAIAVLLNLVCAIIIYRIVTKPVRTLGEVMRSLVEGRLDVDVPYVHQGTEIGSMARKVEVFKQNAIDKKKLEEEQRIQSIKSEEEKKRMREKLASDFEQSVLSVVEIVTSAAGDMQANATKLATVADKTSEQSTTVAKAADQTTGNVQTVAAAIEELSASVNEINLKVTESARMSDEAVNEVKHATETISQMSEAATQINDVVKLIQDIAGQTNLLALNATIEAARAGDAGKGFAVVASEVKTLANQTATATEEIASKIATVQSASTGSVDAIKQIGKTIEKTNEISGTIATAIQQQASAAKNISMNVQQASTGTAQISESIGEVTKEAADSRSAANEVLQDSNKLSEQSENLREQIQTFIAKIRQGT